MTDQLERVRSLLKKVTYKPGWVITAFDHRTMQEPRSDFFSFHNTTRIVLRILCLQPDTISGRQTEIAHHSSLSIFDVANMKDEQLVTYFIARAIRDMELHEMDEWFKFDDIHVKDPHP